MNATRLIRPELRKLTSTRMPWAFLAILAVIAITNAIAVAFGTDMDGSKTFIATAADQQSLMAFAANAMMIAGLFGAMAVAREYGHGTVVPTFLATPRRQHAVLAQLSAVGIGGAVIGLVGSALTVVAVGLSLPTTDFSFLVSAGSVARLVLAASFAGAAGAILGAGIGAVIRNVGGAVTGAVLVLVVAPPLVIQLANEATSWVPNTLANAMSGVDSSVTTPSAILALTAWALIPAAIGLASVVRRDVI